MATRTSIVVTSCMVAYSWGIGSLNNQIQTQVRRLLQLLIHNFRLYLPANSEVAEKLMHRFIELMR